MRSRWIARLGRTAAYCALALAAWALAQGSPAPEAGSDEAVAAPANRAPVLAVFPDGVSVRAGDRATVIVEALDPDAGEGGAAEAVWLSAAAAPERDRTVPTWLTEATWSAAPSERPRLDLTFAPPVNAPTGVYTVEAGATDARGLSTLAAFEVTVLPPRCGALEVDENGVCVRCPENRLPDASRTVCEPCPAGTERPADAAACTACPQGMTSDPGESCGCAEAAHLVDGACVDCPPHTEALGEACVACPPDTERPAGTPLCTDCPAGGTSPGGVACAPPAALKAAAPATAASGGLTAKSSAAADTTAPRIVAAEYAGATVTLTVSEPVWVEMAVAEDDFVVQAEGRFTVTAVSIASREADASEAIVLTLAKPLPGSTEVSLHYVDNRTWQRRPRDAAGNRMGFHTVTVHPRRTLSVGFAGVGDAGIAEDAGEVSVTLALDNPPDAGGYTGCGLRLAAGGVADASDVEFNNADQALNPGNGWSTGAQLLKVVDDAYAEGDETLAVAAFCTSGDAGMDPPAAGLVSEPATVAVADNESRTIAFAADPGTIRETAGATRVTVTATLDGQATEQLDLALTLAGTATADNYTVSGTQSIAIEAGATSGSTVLTVTPIADADDVDQTIAIGATLTGYAVTGSSVVIAEPPPPPTVVASVAAQTLTEDIGKVNVRLTLTNPPDTGGYTGCRLRLGADSEAETPADVTFSNQKKLTADNGWSATAKLLTVVDDTLSEADEALVIEGHCTGRKSGTEPAHTELVSKPLRLVIEDNDTVRALTLAVDPDTIGETLGEQAVEVTATVADAPSSPVAVSLSLGSGAYTVTGAQSVTIPADATSGTTSLAFTPGDDGNATDDAVTIVGTASGYAVTGTGLTIAEPTTVGGVDLSGLTVELTVSPTAIREGTSGAHGLSAKLKGVNVPAVDVAMVLGVGGVATQGASHDYTLTGAAGWDRLTVNANDAHLSADTEVTVSALADNADEGEETVTFTVTQVTWGTTVVALSNPAVATLRITEAWDTPRSPKVLAAVQAPGNETHGLDVNWKSVTATPPVDGYVVRHRAVTDPPAAWTDADVQPGLATVLTALNAGTRYEIRVFARNAAGDGAESGSVFVYTADGGCPMAAPTVTTPQGARSYSDLNVSWQAPACGSSLSGYRVRYREDADVENVENDWTEIAAAGTTATLTGLTADTAYVIAVRAVALGGDKGPWSPEGKGRTGLDTRLPPRLGAPQVAPHAVDGASRLEATWTRVTWTDEDDAVHPIAEYQYRYRPEGTVAWTAETGAQATSEETTTMTRSISGLAVGAWHEVQVRAVNRMSGIAYPGKWSEPGRGRTWGAPDRVEEPSAYLTGSAVEVVWDKPHDGGSPITDYDVDYKARDGGGWDPHTYAGCSMGTCATETSINAVVKKVRVRAENALGMGEWSPTAGVQARKLLRVSYGAASATVNEGESLLVTVMLDSAADRAVSAPVTTTGDATAFRVDGLRSGAAAFGLGTTGQTFTFVAVQDEDDTDEKITLGFGTLPDGVRLTAPASLVVTIRDDETANGRPSFAAGAAATRTVAENAAAGTAVGTPLTATDPEDDALTYTVGGTHAALFTVDGSNGQLQVASGADLDFEGAVMSYAVTVEVSDGRDGAGKADTAVDASIAVTVNVTDVAEPPGAPDAPTLTPTASTLAVAWAAPDNTGPAVIGYDVHYRASGETGWTDAEFAGTGTSTTLASLSAGTAHEVRVRATSDEGTGGWSVSTEENTLPAVSLSAGTLKPEIADGNAAVAVTLSATTNAAGGTLKGAWLARDGKGAVTVLADNIALTAGTAVTRAVSSSAPGPRTFGFRATHTLDGRTRESTEWVAVDWRPQVILSAAPASVAEDGGATAITVTARLTGTALTDAAKTVTVSVSEGTATEGDDFAAVEKFTIGIAGGDRGADGSFELTPVADSAREGPETVAVTGTATDGSPIAVTGTSVSIVDADPKLTVTAPTNGYVTGTTGSGGAAKTVIDCGSGSRTDCSATLASGTVVTLTATADTKYLFGGWTGVCTGTAACTVTLNADSTVGTTFVAARSLTVTAPSHGKVTGRIGTMTIIDCGSDCSETVADGTRVALSASPGSGYEFDGWGDACASETSADCSLTLNADRTVSVAFVSTAIVGKCDESVVDGCERGTLNSAAFGDTDTNHHWRCDGSNGGADSRKCTKAKPGCAGGSQDWNVGYNACRGSVTGGTSGQTRTASDGDGAATGSASFKCDDGTWLEQPGSVCGLECAEDANRTWKDGSDRCSAPLPKTPHLGTRTVTDSVYSGTGSATYKCNDGAWEGPSSSTCRSGCAEQTRSHCDLTNTVDGGSSGECDDDSTGSCSYSCSDGAWSWESGRCNARCPTSTETWRVGNDSCTDTLTGGAHGSSRTARDDTGSARGSASYRCSDGDWLERPGSTCARECNGANKTWNVGLDVCTGSLETKPSGQTDTADDGDYPETGSATYSCSDGIWEGPSGESCYASCAAETIDGCEVSNTVHDGDSGTCESGADACSYTCKDGTWKENSNSCPVDCDASTETWTVGDDSCSAGLAKGKHRSSQDAEDADDPTRGSATYKCEFGEWLEQPGSDCGRQCPRTVASWMDKPDECSAEIATTPHGGTRTVKDTDYSDTGSATYMCVDGDFGEPTLSGCYAGCAAETKPGCLLTDTIHKKSSGTCPADHTGSCSWTCNDGNWEDGSSCTPLPKYTVTIDPVPTKGRVSGSNFVCPGNVCEREFTGKTHSVDLNATANAGYEVTGWSVTGAACNKDSTTESCKFNVKANVEVSPLIRSTLKANAGEEYTATYVYLPLPFGSGSSFYFANVTATASGGVKPYKTFQWSEKPTGATAYYVYQTRSLLPAEETVVVTDSNSDAKDSKAEDTADIVLPSADAVQGATSESITFEVPLGGELYFVWGEDTTITAKPESPAIVSVAVSSPAIRVTGVGLGETHVIVKAGDGEIWLPVVVR